MRVAIKKTKVYKFKELSKEVKEDVIKNWYENEDYPFLEDNISEELKQIDKYFSDTKLQYSLSCCQGDGLSFSGEFDLEKFLNYKTKLKKSVKWAINELICNVSSKGNDGHYCYAHKNDIEYEDNYCGTQRADRLYKLFEDKVLPMIQDYYLGICEKLEKMGYAELDYRMDNKEFAEHSEVNEYEYTKDGKIY